MCTIPVSVPVRSLCFKVILRCLRNVITATLTLKWVPGWRPCTVYWDFASGELKLNMCMTRVWVLYSLKVERCCCLWSFHDKTMVVVVLRIWMDDKETGTGQEGKIRDKMRDCHIHKHFSPPGLQCLHSFTDTYQSEKSLHQEFLHFCWLSRWCHNLLGPQLIVVIFYSQGSMLNDQWAPHTPAETLRWLISF